jgi:hypothetical protein
MMQLTLPSLPPVPEKRRRDRRASLPPPTAQERAEAAVAARQLRECWPDPVRMGDRTSAHLLLSHPRRSTWLTTWANLPGFSCMLGGYQHRLLPGWQYSAEEVGTEMIPDLELLAARGVRPVEATR